jgi:type I restriction enzyme M protein
MEFRFSCPSCGQKLKAEEEHAGQTVDCPHCGAEFCVPQPEPELPSSPAEPPRDRAFVNPNLDGALTCPVGWLRFDTGDIMHLAVHDPAAELSIHGVEKTGETGRLCRLNLAVHGLEGDIKHGGNINSYYDDPHDATGRFNFVLANPPFNVNAEDKERLKDMVGRAHHFPFGLPRTDNANYVWIQLFHSALNEKGRAGFVMANSASDARSSEQELRRKTVRVDEMTRLAKSGLVSCCNM